jgi:hypothetical protein
MPLIKTSREAAYGDDMDQLSKETVTAIQRVKNNMIAINTLQAVVVGDSEMTPEDVAEVDALIVTGYNYIWNQVKTIVPVEYQT